VIDVVEESDVFNADIFDGLLFGEAIGDGHVTFALAVFNDEGNGGASGIVGIAAVIDMLPDVVAILAVRCRILVTYVNFNESR
jgi:hypothetical protein